MAIEAAACPDSPQGKPHPPNGLSPRPSVAAAFAARLPYETFPDGSPRVHFQIEKHVSPCSIVGLGESCEAAVGVGRQGTRLVQAILIELRSSDLVSPAGRARRFPGGVAFGSEGGVLWAGGGGNPGSYGFCANPAANAANRKHPFGNAQPHQKNAAPRHNYPRTGRIRGFLERSRTVTPCPHP